MSKLFDEWWDRDDVYYGYRKNEDQIAENAWQACKAKAIEILKADIRREQPEEDWAWMEERLMEMLKGL